MHTISFEYLPQPDDGFCDVSCGAMGVKLDGRPVDVPPYVIEAAEALAEAVEKSKGDAKSAAEDDKCHAKRDGE